MFPPKRHGPKRPAIGASLHTTGLAVALSSLFAVPFAASPAGFVVINGFNGAGYNTAIDSFASANLGFFPGGLWNASNRLAHGDLITLSTNPASLSLGNAHIRGDVHTPPSWVVSSANLGPAGSIGDNAWVGGGQTGVQPGHARSDAIESYPDATLPDTGGQFWQMAVKGTYTINGTAYDYFLTANKAWKIDGLNGGIYVRGTNVLLQLTGNSASVPSGKIITVGTDASGNPSSLAMYVSAPSFAIASAGITNEGGLARNLQYYGLSSNASITLGGNQNLQAEIYAPEADLTIGGGGNATYDFSGAILTKSVRLNGHVNFHFDESLLPPALRASLTSVSFSSNQAEFFVYGSFGRTYVVQGSSDLLNWVSLATNSAPFGFMDPNSPSFTQRFYRAMTWP